MVHVCKFIEYLLFFDVFMTNVMDICPLDYFSKRVFSKRLEICALCAYSGGVSLPFIINYGIIMIVLDWRNICRQYQKFVLFPIYGINSARNLFASEVYLKLKEAEYQAKSTKKRFSHEEVMAELRKIIG